MIIISTKILLYFLYTVSRIFYFLFLIPIITFITGRKDNINYSTIQTFYIKNIKMSKNIHPISSPHQPISIISKLFLSLFSSNHSIPTSLSLSLSLHLSQQAPSLRGRKGNMNYIRQTNYFKTILQKKHILLFIYVLVCFISR